MQLYNFRLTNLRTTPPQNLVKMRQTIFIDTAPVMRKVKKVFQSSYREIHA